MCTQTPAVLRVLRARYVIYLGLEHAKSLVIATFLACQGDLVCARAGGFCNYVTADRENEHTLECFS